MSRIEDEIRQVMADHDRHAPGADHLLRALEAAAGPRRPGPRWLGPRRLGPRWPGPRRLGPQSRPARWYLPVLAAASVAVVVAGSVWAGEQLGGHRRPHATASSHPGHASPLSCPARYARSVVALWVPAPPAGVDGGSRLVPRRTPTSAVVCAYAGFNTDTSRSAWALSGRRVLVGGFARLAGQLSWQLRTHPGQSMLCTQVAGPQTDYLIGLTYARHGTVWVAAAQDPNDCAGTSNGQFTGSRAVGPTVQRAFRSGRWPPRQRGHCNQIGGRRGQDTTMVPAGATSMLICAPAAHVIRSRFQALVAALNSLPARLSTLGCSSSHRPSGVSDRSRGAYQLVFSYPVGPPVRVDIMTGCYPEIDNYSLQANNASTVLPIIHRLLRSS